MTTKLFPLLMEQDKSKIGVTVWADTGAELIAFSHTKDSANHKKVESGGELFCYMQKMIDQGFGGEPRPNLADIPANKPMMGMAQISAMINASDFGMLDEVSMEQALSCDGANIHHWHHHRWTHNGRNVYALSPALVEAFLETDLTVVPKDLELPETTCFIAMPATDLKVWHPQTGYHDLAGFYVTLTEKRFYFCACGFAKPGQPQHDNVLSTCTMGLSEDRSIKEWLEAEKDNPISKKIMEVNIEATSSWFSLVVNTLMYLAHVRDDVHHDKNHGVPAKVMAKVQKLGKKSQEKLLAPWRSACRYHVLGSTIPSLKGEGSGEGSSIGVRFLVRGHWRNQAVGPQRRDRKLTWIRPHYKGPQDGPLSGTTHVTTVE